MGKIKKFVAADLINNKTARRRAVKSGGGNKCYGLWYTMITDGYDEMIAEF